MTLRCLSLINNIFIITLMTLFASASFALAPDEQKPLRITSDSFNLDYDNGIATYRGNVVAIQGTRHMAGNTVIVESHAGEIQRVTVLGDPANYSYQPRQSAPTAHAKAKTIQFEPAKHTLTLIENAELEQDGNIFRGPKMTYNTRTKIVNSPASAIGRSTMIIKPMEVGAPAAAADAKNT